MSYRIEIGPTARREIKSLSAYRRAQARLIIAALAVDPRPARAKQLLAEPVIYRVWLARRRRIAYEIVDAEERIRILRVQRNEDVDFERIAGSSYLQEAPAEYDAVFRPRTAAAEPSSDRG